METPDGHAIHYDATGAVMGITLLGVRRALERDGEITLEFPAERLAAEQLQPLLLVA